MTHMFSLLPMLACGAMFAMMFGAGAIVWLATRSPLGRLSWFERHAHRAHPKAQDVEHGSSS
jgi:hypothetical protein